MAGPQTRSCQLAALQPGGEGAEGRAAGGEWPVQPLARNPGEARTAALQHRSGRGTLRGGGGRAFLAAAPGTKNPSSAQFLLPELERPHFTRADTLGSSGAPFKGPMVVGGLFFDFLCFPSLGPGDGGRAGLSAALAGRLFQREPLLDPVGWEPAHTRLLTFQRRPCHSPGDPAVTGASAWVAAHLPPLLPASGHGDRCQRRAPSSRHGLLRTPPLSQVTEEAGGRPSRGQPAGCGQKQGRARGGAQSSAER